MPTKSNIKSGLQVFPPLKRLLFTLGIAVMGLVVCFAVLEMWVRLTRPKINLDELTGRIPGPNPMAAWAYIDAFSAYRRLAPHA